MPEANSTTSSPPPAGAATGSENSSPNSSEANSNSKASPADNPGSQAPASPSPPPSSAPEGVPVGVPEFHPNHGVKITHDLRTIRPEMSPEAQKLLAPFDPSSPQTDVEKISIPRSEYDALCLNKDIAVVVPDLASSEISRSEAVAVLNSFLGTKETLVRLTSQTAPANNSQDTNSNSKSDKRAQTKKLSKTQIILIPIFSVLFAILVGFSLLRNRSRSSGSASPSARASVTKREYYVGFNAWSQALPQALKMAQKSLLFVTTNGMEFPWENLTEARRRGYDVRILIIGNKDSRNDIVYMAQQSDITTYLCTASIGTNHVCWLLLDQNILLDGSNDLAVSLSNVQSDIDKVLTFVETGLSKQTNAIYVGSQHRK